MYKFQQFNCSQMILDEPRPELGSSIWAAWVTSHPNAKTHCSFCAGLGHLTSPYAPQGPIVLPANYQSQVMNTV